MLNHFAEFMYGLGARIGDLDLDNVDLSSNVKHDDGRSVVLYSNFPQPSSYRRKNFSYYKVISLCFYFCNYKQS